MRTVLMTILIHYPPQHLSSTIIIEVGINIRKVDTVRIQETFKQQIVLQWVYLCDTQAVSHYRTCCRTTSWSYNNPQFLTCSTNEVRHNQEVARETHCLHDVQLKVDVLIHILRQRVAISFLGTFVCQVLQILRLKLDAVYLIISTQTVDDFLSFLWWKLILSIFIGSKLLEQVFLGNLLS